MNPRSRRLCFTVGTSLLTASLSITTGCAKKNHVNVAPPDGPNVNVAAQEDPPAPPADTPTDAPSDDAPSGDGESPEGEGEGEGESPE